MAEKILGYSIEVKGTDQQLKQQEALKKSILETTDRIRTLKEATKDNIEAQKAHAGTLASLETHLKAEKKLYGDVTKEILVNSVEVERAAGSYDALVDENKKLVEEYRKLSPLIPEQAERMKTLSAIIFENNEKLKDMDASMNRHHRNVGNYSGALGTLAKGLKGFGGLSGLLGKAIGIDPEAIGAIKVAEKGLADLNRTLNLSKLAKAEDEAATVKLTIAQRILNAVKQAGIPIIGLVIGAFTALAAAAGVVYSALSRKSEAHREAQKAMDGTIIKDKQLREAYNNHLVVLREVEIEYRVLRGEISEFQGELEKLQVKHEQAVNKIKSDTAEKIAEANTIWGKFLDLFSAGGFTKAKELEAIAEGNKKILAEEKNLASERAKAKLENDKKLQKETEDLEKWVNDFIEKKKEEEKKERERRSKELQDEIKKNNETIFRLIRENAEAEVKLQEESTEKKIEILAERANTEIIELRRQLVKKEKLREDEIALNEQINQKIILKEKQLRKDIENLAKEGDEKEIQDKIRQVQTIQAIDEAHILTSEQNEKEKAKAILQVRIKSYQNQIELLKASGKAESLEVQKQIADLELQIAKATAEIDKKGGPRESYFAKLLGITDTDAQLLVGKAEELLNMIDGIVFEGERRRLEQQFQMRNDALQNQYDSESRMLDEQVKNGIITQQQAEEKRAFMQQEMDKKKLELQRAAFEKEKQIRIKELAIDYAKTIASITLQALAQPDSVATFGLTGVARIAALVGLATPAYIAQLALIKSQKFAKGKIGIDGPGTSTSDSIPALLSRGESVINTRATEMFGPLLSLINETGNRFARGSVPLPPAPVSNASAIQQLFNIEGFAEKIVSGINSKKVFIVEKEMRDASNRAILFEESTDF